MREVRLVKTSGEREERLLELRLEGRKEVERRNKGVGRGDYSRSVKEVRASNTPSSRDSIEFESKYVLKK